ncbi:MAG: NfeD family protein [Candidatus Euphemobacter frigidus]|nr:NfeD family protein [Candidatus Euphemobacter frigidus]MDP8275473.1 NfeD family protein [Candidatus Euphemobacter frigidus]
MIHHPIILVPKLVLLAVIIVVLIILHGSLSPAHFKVAVIISIAAFLFLSIVLWIVVLRTLKNPRSKLARQTILFSEARSSDGFQAGSGENAELVGSLGTSVSQLRPSGIARIRGKRVSVITEGAFIPANSPVEVIEVKGLRVIVRAPNGPDKRSGEGL